MGDLLYAARPKIKINMSEVTDTFYSYLEKFVVDFSPNMPAMFTIVLRDEAATLLKDSKYKMGGTVSVDIGAARLEGETKDPLFTGEITAHEMIFDVNSGTHCVIRGYDKSHRLHRTRATQTYLNKKDSEVVQQLAAECGLSATIDATQTRHEHIFRVNQTPWEFMAHRAAEIGYSLDFADGKILFKKAKAPGMGSAEVTLKMFEQLIYFRPKATAGSQVKDVDVQSWDFVKKEEIKATTTVSDALGAKVSGNYGPSSFTPFGTSKFSKRGPAYLTKAEAQEASDGLARAVASVTVEAEGLCYGDPKIKPGKEIEVKEVGQFSGKYKISSAKHTFDGVNGYRTEFTVSGLASRSMATLASPIIQTAESSGFGQKMPGVVIGLVTNNYDSAHPGRVKVKFPWLDDSAESFWLRVATVGAGDKRGFHATPEVGDEVLVAFEHGDSHRGYVIGSLWNGKDKPLPAPGDLVKDKKGTQWRGFVSKKGHRVIFHDADDKLQIEIMSGNEKNFITIDEKNKSITIETEGKIDIKAKQDVTLMTDGAVKYEAKGDVTIKGNNVNIEATAGLKAKGNQVDVEGTMTNVKGSTMLNLN